MNCNNNNDNDNYSDRLVVNLSSHNLSQDQLNVLQKGLNFCPTPGEPLLGDIRRDLDRFHLSIRRRAFFQKFPSDSDPPDLGTRDDDTLSKFRNPSSWSPQGPPTVEGLIDQNEMAFERLPVWKPHHDNLTHGERQAVAELKQLPNIIIKRADKGSAVVLQDKKDYVQEALRQLNNREHYIPQTENLTEKHNLEVHMFVNSMLACEEIENKCRDYLCISKPRTPLFYLLPKIHKQTRPPPGRPILSANECPTERISKFVDHFLQPIVSKTRSYIKDTTHFIQKLKSIGTLPEGALLVSMDVTGLYTNIPHLAGKRATARHLARHRPGGTNPSNQSLITLLDFILTKNNFEFDGQHYLQISGTAMGTRVAPSYANLFMADFEDQYIFTYPLQPLLYGRFIDDCFLIWTHSRADLDLFFNFINSRLPSIKFTTEVSDSQTSFLDSVVKVDTDHNIYTDLFSKPTDSHNYLFYTSAHPKSCTRGIPYSQFLRVRRICSRIQDFDDHCITLATHFHRRGYPTDLVSSALIKARRTDRDALLNPQRNNQTEDTSSPFYFIHTFHPGFTGPSTIIKKNWDILARHRHTQPIYETRVIFGHRRPPNLKDMLVRARLSSDPSTPANHPQNNNQPHNQYRAPCKTTRCRYCPRIDHSGSITSTTTGRKYYSKTKVDCKSNNLIYCITCQQCQIQYVGQTKRTLMERFQGHFYNITSENRDDNIGNHFNLPGHSGIADVHIHIVDLIHSPPELSESLGTRLNLESNWIHRLRTPAPWGLNLMDTPGRTGHT